MAKGTFNIVQGSTARGYANVTVSANGNDITATGPYGNQLSGDKAGMVELALDILNVAGVQSTSPTAAPSHTGWFGEQGEDGVFCVYDAEGSEIIRFVPNPGTHRAV